MRDATGKPTAERRFGGLLTDHDLHLFSEGTFFRSWEKLGAHPLTLDGVAGTHFAVWAPNAHGVDVIGDFNGWREGEHALRPAGESGLWAGFVPGIAAGALYKYVIRSRVDDRRAEKADPYAFAFELRPRTASMVWDIAGFPWADGDWLSRRAERDVLREPMSAYEVHLGSWMRVPGEGDRWLTYRELAPRLADYCREMGFTHVELMPVAEHPFDGSWGYQVLGFFAPTARFGTPQDFMFLVDTLHRAGIGVILDWVPGHFPQDEHGLGVFDGTHLYEHEDPRQGVHQDWGTFVFNYGRTEVVNFLISNALFWLEHYHIDGLRVDAVASMLYLDYSREDGEWVPNEFGGRENLAAIEFVKRLNTLVYEQHPGVVTIAEESTAWPMVSRPVYLGGLGFGMKWNMGWMNDTLRYLSQDPIHRKYHHGELTFSLIYAFDENFVLPLSHDEVVHGKGSLRRKMPGDDWQQFANLRALYGYMWTHPGKKLLFMGCEFGQWNEWNHDLSLDWHLLDEDPRCAGLRRWVRDLNAAMRTEPALHRRDAEPGGFRWIDCHDSEQSVLSFLRHGDDAADDIVVICNLTPLPRPDYRVGVPAAGHWAERLNSDDPRYGGSGQGNPDGADSTATRQGDLENSIVVLLPPLSVVAFRRAPG